MEYLLCAKILAITKKSVFPNFIIKCFLGLEIEFYGKGFIGYILREEREGQVDPKLFAFNNSP